MSFLKAEWRKLAIANYKIDPAVLAPYVPPGTELDLWENNCYVSLVGFMFLNTKLLGLPIPFHRNFEEVNLRFYVRHRYQGEWRRGVVFIKEIVPKAALTFVANVIYKEHYHTMKMSHQWTAFQDHMEVRYLWHWEGRENSFIIKAALNATPLIKGSEEAFITEHYWGYTSVGERKAYEYEVTHPVWDCYSVMDYQIEVDFETVYGHDFALLNTLQPSSVMLAEGSAITVENKRRI